MANLPETPSWESGIHQLEEADRAKAGPGGILNLQPKQLANRTQYLKQELDAYVGLIESGDSPYSDVPAAQSAINEGKISLGDKFSVRSEDNESWADEYINANGLAVFTGKKLPSDDFIKKRVPDFSVSKNMIPLIVGDDALQKVALWEDYGKLNGIPLHDDYVKQVQEGMAKQDYVEHRLPQPKTSPKLTPLIIGDSENPKAALWEEDGRLNGIPLHANYILQAQDGVAKLAYVDKLLPQVQASPKLTPLIIGDGNYPHVALWEEDGKLNSIPLHDNLIAQILESAGSLIPKNKKSVSDGATLWQYRAKKSRLDLNASTKLKIGFTGDSWTEHSTIPQVFADYFYEKYGKSGDGWIQLNIDNPNQLNGIVLTRDGWAVYDASGNAVPAFPTAMDGMYIYTNSTTSTLSLNNLFSSSLRIFYYDNNGTFRYSVNGGEPVIVKGSGTNKIVSVTISGLDIAIATTLTLDSVGNAGTVVIYGFYSEGTGSGIEINKMGNGGITAPQYIKTLGYLPQTASIVAPDLLIMIIGTNDFRTNVPLQGFRDGLTWWLNAWKAVIPDSAIIIVSPSQGNATGQFPLSDYRDIMREVALNAGVEFYSLFDFMNTTWAKSNAQGLWLNSLHLSSVGARFLLNQLNFHFMEN